MAAFAKVAAGEWIKNQLRVWMLLMAREMDGPSLSLSSSGKNHSGRLDTQWSQSHSIFRL